MSVWSNYIIGIIISALILTGIGILILTKMKRNPFKRVGKVEKVKQFLRGLDQRYPPINLTELQKENRELELINSGFTISQIEKAQGVRPKKETELEKVLDWFDNAGKQMSLQQAENTLIYNGWDKKLVKKALKIIKKETKQNGTRINATRELPKLPTIADTNTDTGTESRNDTGPGELGRGDGNGEVEHKRLLPIQPIKYIDPNERKPQWNWSSIKSNR